MGCIIILGSIAIFVFVIIYLFWWIDRNPPKIIPYDTEIKVIDGYHKGIIGKVKDVTSTGWGTGKYWYHVEGKDGYHFTVGYYEIEKLK